MLHTSCSPSSALARAYGAAGDGAHARKAYQDLLDLWKYCDPDIPILKQAKAEYAQAAISNHAGERRGLVARIRLDCERVVAIGLALLPGVWQIG